MDRNKVAAQISTLFSDMHHEAIYMLRVQTTEAFLSHKWRHKHPWQESPPGGRRAIIPLLMRSSNVIRVPRSSQTLPHSLTSNTRNRLFSSMPWNSPAAVLHCHLKNVEVATRDVHGHLSLSSSTYRAILALLHVYRRRCREHSQLPYSRCFILPSISI